MKAPARWDLKVPLFLGVLTLGAAVLIMAQRPATSSTRPAMNPPLKHHTVTFPDCRLEFDYPADLKPSPDFFTHRMLPEVDYATVRWTSPDASDSFVLLRSDLNDPKSGLPLATLSIEMWLCTPSAGFTADIRDPGQLKASIHVDRVARNNPVEAEEITINGRSWCYLPDIGNLSTPLNGRIYLCARVSAVANTRNSQAWEDWADQARQTILGSLRLLNTKTTNGNRL